MHMHKSLVAAALLAVSTIAGAAESLKPFVLAYSTSGEVESVAAEVKNRLLASGFDVVGSYSPYAKSTVIAISNDALKRNAAASEFGGYGAAQRVAVTEVDGKVQVSYTHPTYMAHAYRMKGELTEVSEGLAKALGSEKSFGPEHGLTSFDLRQYHYMFGMEYFDEPSLLAEYDSHKAALDAVEKNLAGGVGGVTRVYRVDIPGKEETVFGVGLKGEGKQRPMDDGFIMGEIDFKPLRSTAHLPYEMLVSDNKVYALYARFRIAINFPDLSMMGDNSFMKIMDSPEAIRRALTQAAGGKVEDI